MKPEHEDAVGWLHERVEGLARAALGMTRRGLVALGDSITNGHGEPALGVHDAVVGAVAGRGARAAVHQARARRRPRARRAGRAGPAPGGPLRRRLPLRRRQRRALGRLGRRRLRARPCARPPPRWRRAASGCCSARCPPTSAARGRRPSRAPRAPSSAPWRASTAPRWPTSTTSPARPGCCPTRSTPPPAGSSRSPTAPPARWAPRRSPRRSIEIHGSRRARARFAARWGVLLAARPAPARGRARPRALAARQHEAELEHAVVAHGDEAGHARRLDGEGREADRRAADELQAPAGQALAADGDRDRRAPAVEGQRALAPPARRALSGDRPRQREARGRVAVGLDGAEAQACRRGAPGRSAPSSCRRAGRRPRRGRRRPSPSPSPRSCARPPCARRPRGSARRRGSRRSCRPARPGASARRPPRPRPPAPARPAGAAAAARRRR